MFRRPKPRSLKRSLLNATTQAVAIVSGFYLAFTLAPSASPIQPITDRPDAPSYVERLIASNDCWTGEDSDPGVLPGHVVATSPEHPVAARIYGSRVVGLALEQIFDGKDHGLTVHAFCR